ANIFHYTVPAVCAVFHVSSKTESVGIPQVECSVESNTTLLLLLVRASGQSRVCSLATGIMAHICRKDFVKEGEEIPLICETKPMISIQQLMSYQKNGCFLSPLPPDKKKSSHLSPHHYKRDYKDKDHCTIDMNGLETNV
uniref:Uncharacterized protein n=1 Tax=Sinocyclocheilus grahami TaxID=75366 RepID=A0A672P5Y3_SINGR